MPRMSLKKTLSPTVDREALHHRRDGKPGPWESACLVLLLLHVAALIAHHGLGLPYRHKAVFLFHADFERNLPTLFSVLLLLRAGWLSWAAAALPRLAATRDRLTWQGLALIFGFLAADEALSIHEALIPPMRRWLAGSALGDSTFLTFAWILPYGLLVLLLAAGLLGWLLRLPARSRRWLLLSAALYLTGALVLEAVGGWWIGGDLARRDLGYDLWVSAEEFLEMAGLLVFAVGVRQYSSTAIEAVSADQPGDVDHHQE